MRIYNPWDSDNVGPYPEKGRIRHRSYVDVRARSAYRLDEKWTGWREFDFVPLTRNALEQGTYVGPRISMVKFVINVRYLLFFDHFFTASFGKGQINLQQEWMVHFRGDTIYLNALGLDDLGSQGEGDVSVRANVYEAHSLPISRSPFAQIVLHLSVDESSSGISIGYAGVSKQAKPASSHYSGSFEFNMRLIPMETYQS